MNVLVNDIVVQGDGNIVSDMGGDKVMLSIKNGKYYNLGEIGGEIWDLMKEPIEVNQLIQKLSSVFQVEKEECKDQVLSFLKDLYKEDLIQIR